MSENGLKPYIESNYDQFLKELIAWLKIPSISSDPAYKKDIVRSIEYASDLLKPLGFKTEVFKTSGHPSLYAERIEDPKLPTVLIYGHLDVQPVDPLNQWKRPPFEPWIEDGHLYGRGSADDKGQTIIHILACRYWIQKHGKLPVNIKFIIEGEEEIGSPNFAELLKNYKSKLGSDVIIISDTAMVRKGYPTLGYATRGLAYFELHVEGPKVDLHSGSFGGVVKNPLMVLAQILASVVDAKGKITLPSFYKDVANLSSQEKKWFKRVQFLGKDLAKIAGMPDTGGETGVPVMERVWGRPTFEVHGLSGGFQGTGSKTIIPQRAMAKVSFRLVPKQDPNKVAKAFEAFVKKTAPKGLKVKLVYLPGGGPAFLENVNHPAFKAAARALKSAFKAEPVFARAGGSIFAPELFKKAFPKTPTLMMGFGLPDENSHAPNERLDLDNFRKGIESCARFYQELLAK